MHEVLWQQDILYIILTSPVNSYCKAEYLMTEAYKVHNNSQAVISFNNPGEGKKGWEHLGAFWQQKNEDSLFPSPLNTYGYWWLVKIQFCTDFLRWNLTLTLDIGNSFCSHYNTITQLAVWLKCTV